MDGFGVQSCSLRHRPKTGKVDHLPFETRVLSPIYVWPRFLVFGRCPLSRGKSISTAPRISAASSAFGFWMAGVRNSNRAARYSVSFSLIHDSWAIRSFGDSRSTFMLVLLVLV